MKKYLLAALLWVFGLFGFASALEISGWDSYTPSRVTVSSSTEISLDIIWDSVYSCSSDRCTIWFVSSLDYSTVPCGVWYDDGGGPAVWQFVPWEWVDVFDCTLTPWDYYVVKFDWWDNSTYFPSITIDSANITVYSSSDSGGSDSSDWLLSGWTAVFWWIISSLGSAISEFIPYVAYIWLWLLGAIIWFVAIKRLINRVRAKIFWTFNSRRRK